MSSGYDLGPKSDYAAVKQQLLDAQSPNCWHCPEAQRETVVSAVQVFMGEVAINFAKDELTPRIKAGCRYEKPAKYTVNPEDAPVCNVERSDYA